MKPLKALAVQPRKVDTVFDEVERIEKQIMRRAYDLFLNRGALDGGDLEDWFAAENELTWKVAVELSEKETEYVVRAAVPGLEAKDLDVQVTSDDLVIKAATSHTHKEEEGTVHICEFRSGELFRRIHFPKKIDPNQVKAEYSNGMLRIIAPIVKEEQARKVDIGVSGGM
jgi:HSP20 family protein